MAKTPNPADAPAPDFDDLLGAGDTETAATVDSGNEAAASAPAEPQETPEQRRIRELEAELAKPLVTAKDDSPVFQEEVEKTPEQIRIEELEAQLAVRNAQRLENAQETFVPSKGDALLIHVVEDGFTEFDRVWYRGQEIRIDAEAYKRTQDRNGDSWVDHLLNDPHAQYAKWGRVYVAPGPFVPRPGEVFDDSLVREDARRNGAVPVLTARD